MRRFPPAVTLVPMRLSPSRKSGGDHRTDAVAQLRALYAIGQAGALARSDEELLQHAAEAARRALGAASVSIERFERERGQMRVLVNVGELGPHEAELPDDETYAIGEFSTVQLLDGAAPGIVISLADQDPSAAEHELLRTLGKHSSLEVPIRIDDMVWGELFATRTADDPRFLPDDLDVAAAVAAQVAAGIARGAHARRVADLAYRDSLTGLANRAAVEERLSAALQDFAHDGRPVTVSICDVNGLKQVNDQGGHDAGDRLLTQVAELLSLVAAPLPGSLVGRLGGDEFCLVADGAAADRVVEVMGELCRHAGRIPGGTGLSCGIASTADAIGQVLVPRDLLRLADGAQYRAKRAHSSVPVVAGRALPKEVADHAAAVANAPPDVDRRRYRGELDPARLALDDLVGLLDEHRGDGVVDRLALVGDGVAQLVEAVAWWVSTVDLAPATGPTLISGVRYGAYRASERVHLDQDSYLGTAQGYVLDELPDTVRALRGGWFVAALDGTKGDPGELKVLVEEGCTGLLGVGATRAGIGYLLEVFADEFSAPVAELGPAVRALVALAVSDASAP